MLSRTVVQKYPCKKTIGDVNERISDRITEKKDKPTEKETVIDRIHRVKNWGHRIQLPHNLITPGEWSYHSLETFDISSEEIEGKTVLDIGALDGEVSFLAEAAGASRVVAMDIYENFDDEVDKNWYENIRNGAEAILTAKEILNSKVEVWNMSVYDLSPKKVGKFDIVFFLGVLYHLRYPFLALEKVASVTNHMAIIGSHVFKDKNKIPVMRFSPDIEVDKNPTNWWFPNPSCLKKLVEASGFQKADFVADKYIQRPSESMPVSGKIKKNAPFYELPNGRVKGEVKKGQEALILGNMEGQVEVDFLKEEWIRIRIRVGTRKVKGYVKGDCVVRTRTFKQLIASFLPFKAKCIIKKFLYAKLYGIRCNIVKGFK